MSERLVTVFGGSGFIGRHVVNRLARTQARVRVAVRDPEGAKFLKAMGEVGQVQPVYADIVSGAGIAEAVRDANSVVNSIGIMFESGQQRFRSVQAEGAGGIAEAAAKAGVQSLVHLSAIGADSEGEARYARTKGDGEAQVRKAFPEASILRPSVVFGPEDNFFNLFARLTQLSPALPLIGGGKTRFQPVYVGDVADAVVNALADANAAGKTYELGGPAVCSFAELMKILLDTLKRERMLVSVPWPIAMVQGAIMELMPQPMLTRDQVALLRHDNVVNPDMPGLDALGITPTPMDVVLPTYLSPYSRRGQWTNVRTA